jgi:hypothetical protein
MSIEILDSISKLTNEIDQKQREMTREKSDFERIKNTQA